MSDDRECWDDVAERSADDQKKGEHEYSVVIWQTLTYFNVIYVIGWVAQW